MLYVLKLSRRKKSVTFSPADSRVRRFIKSDVSESGSVSISGVVMMETESVSETSDFIIAGRGCLLEKTSLLFSNE